VKTWNEIKSDFNVDGTLRDIYVEDIDIDIWNLFLRKIEESSYKISFFHGELKKDLPNLFSNIKFLQQSDSTILSIWLNENIHLNCHFFIDSEIELDLTVQEIQVEQSFILLQEFMVWLSHVVKKEVKLTHEGMQNDVIMKVIPPS